MSLTYLLTCASTANSSSEPYRHQIPCYSVSQASGCAVHFLLDLLKSLIGLAGDASSCAANGHDKDVSNSLSLSAQPGTASTPVKGTSSKGGNEFVASGLGGAHGASPDQEAARNAKGQHAATKQEDSAGDGPGAAGTNKESDTAKTAGRKTEGGDADSGHDGAAQMTETGTARKDTAAADAGAGKKKNKSKKKKKGK